MAGTSQQNGVAEIRNSALIEMVRSMINNIKVLPVSLWEWSFENNYTYIE